MALEADLEDKVSELDLCMSSVGDWRIIRRRKPEYVSKDLGPIWVQTIVLDREQLFLRLHGKTIEKQAFSGDLAKCVAQFYREYLPCVGYQGEIAQGKWSQAPPGHYVSGDCQLFTRWDSDEGRDSDPSLFHCEACRSNDRGETIGNSFQVKEEDETDEDRLMVKPISPRIKAEVRGGQSSSLTDANLVAQRKSKEFLRPKKPKIAPLDDLDGFSGDVEEETTPRPRKKLDGERMEYPCDHCGRTFYHIKSYQQHRRLLKKREQVLKCKLCPFSTPQSKLLADHGHEEHIRESDLFQSYTQDELEVSRMQDPRQCRICDFTFNGSVLLYRHRSHYHELGAFVCPDCQSPQLTFYDLLLHGHNDHGQDLVREVPPSHGLEEIVHPEGKIELKRSAFTCHDCRKAFSSDSACSAHMRQNHAWGIFECEECSLNCHYATDMSAHALNFHVDAPVIKCPTCMERFNLSEDREVFNQHYAQDCSHREFGAKGGHMQCEHCGKNYATRYAFEAHLQSHLGIEKFKCLECEYTTNHKAVMVDHEKMHLREKGLTNGDCGVVLFHQCHICGKQFHTPSNLKKHIKTVHQGIRKEIICPDCDMKFYSNGAYYNHKKKLHGFVSNRTRRGKHSLT